MVYTIQRPVSEDATKIVSKFESSYAATANLEKIKAYVVHKHPELAPQISSIEAQYRQYMYLCGLGKFHNLSVPSLAVDQLWHAHILHTVEYRTFCLSLCGRFIEHNPFDDSTDVVVKRQSSINLLKASRLIFESNVFGLKAGPQTENADCGYCGGCSSCEGPCGGAPCATSVPTISGTSALVLVGNFAQSQCTGCTSCSNCSSELTVSQCTSCSNCSSELTITV